MADEYEELPETIAEAFKGFNFKDYRTFEEEVLRTAFDACGYRGVEFRMGEEDSFGPLTRVIECFDREGVHHKFVYG